jgi:DNA-directed RNA polymerase specialized sigma24 family protein
MNVKTTIQQKALRYYLLGLNSKEIGKLLDLSPRTVQRYMSEGKFKSQRQVKNLSAKAFEMLNKGYTYKEIAKAVGKSKTMVYYYIKEARMSKNEGQPTQTAPHLIP